VVNSVDLQRCVTELGSRVHEYAKRAATRAGIGFTELDNGFAMPVDSGSAA
jgi:hypothetical protein